VERDFEPPRDRLVREPLADRGKHLELARREERALAQDIGLPEFAADEGRRLSLAEVYRSLR
jgi:hypothetical protein